ncbi:hypothetical protein AD998_01030 [bacterium 336/3]|nr:hypothetical protein AD998_01030 [bacterium 336/3]
MPKSFKIIILGFAFNIPVGFVLWSILWNKGLGILGFTVMIALIFNGYLLAWYWRTLSFNLLERSLLGWLSMILNHILFFGTEFFIIRHETFNLKFVSNSIGFFILYYPFCWLGFIIYNKFHKKGS